MYNVNEIEIIINSCNSVEELYAVSACFQFLIKNEHQKRSAFLSIYTLVRFGELEKLNEL